MNSQIAVTGGFVNCIGSLHAVTGSFVNNRGRVHVVQMSATHAFKEIFWKGHVNKIKEAASKGLQILQEISRAPKLDQASSLNKTVKEVLSLGSACGSTCVRDLR